jgi:hypothetical protein
MNNIYVYTIVSSDGRKMLSLGMVSDLGATLYIEFDDVGVEEFSEKVIKCNYPHLCLNHYPTDGTKFRSVETPLDESIPGYDLKAVLSHHEAAVHIEDWVSAAYGVPVVGEDYSDKQEPYPLSRNSVQAVVGEYGTGWDVIKRLFDNELPTFLCERPIDLYTSLQVKNLSSHFEVYDELSEHGTSVVLAALVRVAWACINEESGQMTMFDYSKLGRYAGYSVGAYGYPSSTSPNFELEGQEQVPKYCQDLSVGNLGAVWKPWFYRNCRR